MARKKYHYCPYCKKRYLYKDDLYRHLNNKHEDQLGDLSPARAYFNYRNKKTHGSCIMCKRETEWNEDNERYERLCSRPACKDAYRDMFRRRMRKTYGKDHLLDDPEKQKEMLANRSISGKYRWSDGGEILYTGSYERDCLKYLDKELGFSSKDIVAPAPMSIPYTFEGNEHFYIPDFYIISLKLLIEVKGSNNHYQKRDLKQEKAKDKAALASRYNYVKVLDKDYKGLNKIISELRNF